MVMHHTTLILGQTERQALYDLWLTNLNFEAKANPDFLQKEIDTFGIDDARELINWSLGRPLLGGAKVALIVTPVVTLEAQNALLKLFEEPPLGTYLFLQLENLGNLLPTFLSRVMVLNFSSESKNLNLNQAKKFLKSSVADRLAMIGQLAKSLEKNSLKQLIKDLESIAYQYGQSEPDQKAATAYILQAKILATARGASAKMILEWLAFML